MSIHRIALVYKYIYILELTRVYTYTEEIADTERSRTCQKVWSQRQPCVKPCNIHGSSMPDNLGNKAIQAHATIKSMAAMQAASLRPHITITGATMGGITARMTKMVATGTHARMIVFFGGIAR